MNFRITYSTVQRGALTTRDDEEILVSYDVTVLIFMAQCRLKRQLRLFLKRLEEDETLSDRTSLSIQSLRDLFLFCVKSNYFKCNGKVYGTTTCPVGSPLSAVLASIFIEHFEERTLSDFPGSY